MSSQLNLLDAPAPEVEDIWEKVHEYTPPRKYWQDFVEGEILKNTTRWGDNRLCVLKKIVNEVFGKIKYLDNGKTELISLYLLVPASPEEVEGVASANH